MPFQGEYLTACNLTNLALLGAVSKNCFDATDKLIGWTNCRNFHVKGVFAAIKMAVREAASWRPVRLTAP